MNSVKLTQNIKKLCLEEGFTKIGITKAQKLRKEITFLEKQIKEGKTAELNWLKKNINKRKNPLQLLENVKSVISLALLYNSPFKHSRNPDIPKISRYAWGKEDYHNLIKKKLKFICDKIICLDENIKLIFYVDDGPVMEKVWAEKSGLGWRGKHTLIINPKFGSFFFLSEIFINKELVYDKPVENLCGKCNICVKSCPTNAIYEPYKLDLNLCIAYHTIESKKEKIPINTGNWLFGCDICQDVCPYNHKKIYTNNEKFYSDKSVFGKNYDELCNMTEEEFIKTFKNTPLKRLGYKRWRRNILNIKNSLS